MAKEFKFKKEDNKNGFSNYAVVEEIITEETKEVSIGGLQQQITEQEAIIAREQEVLADLKEQLKQLEKFINDNK